jgi:cytochrome c oxidase subunit III
MSASSHGKPYYFVPDPSKYPVLSGVALLCFGIGMAALVNDFAPGPYLVVTGLCSFLAILYCWFGQAAKESEAGHYEANVDRSFRWSMAWFIFSEVMFFAGFFGALFYAKNISTPWLANPALSGMLWPAAQAVWPNFGPGGLDSLAVDHFDTMGPWPIPTLNTAILLLSGVTLTVSHHALRDGDRAKTKLWLAFTVALGMLFMGFQGYEYYHAYHELNLKMTSGIYGSTFFMLTGFHGFHVILGSIMLACVLYRLNKGHFTADKHFGFEGAAWYWHFVDVVWLFLYIVVYWA